MDIIGEIWDLIILSPVINILIMLSKYLFNNFGLAIIALTIIIRLLTLPGQLVFDPFAGTGTTAVAAERLGRRWLATELNPQYAEALTSRLRRLVPPSEAAPVAVQSQYARPDPTAP